MRVIAVYPEEKRLQELTESILAVHPNCVIHSFRDQMMAVKYGYNNPVDVLYTLLPMRPMDGFAVAGLLRKQHPVLRVNFISTDGTEYAEAMRFGMNSYVIEPVTADSLRAAEQEHC